MEVEIKPRFINSQKEKHKEIFKEESLKGNLLKENLLKEVRLAKK